jgi:hypothetical protein
MYVTLDDVNMHLPTDKLEITAPDLNLYELDARRIIRGFLAGVFPAVTIAGWTDPTETDSTTTGYVPELIKAIAGRFIAAFYYKERYSEDSLEIPAYAQQKYDEAMALINGIIAGTLTMIDVVDTPTDSNVLTADDFWPNGTTEPVFTMDDTLFSLPPTGRIGHAG